MIRWNETGDLIVIERPVELTELILPKDFRQSRFASFTRQLNVGVSADDPDSDLRLDAQAQPEGRRQQWL